MAAMLRIVARDRFGLLPDGLPLFEGAREVGATGDWLLLAPRVYLIRVRQLDGSLSPERAVEALDFQQRTEEIDVDA
jgi:hypothetical protein